MPVRLTNLSNYNARLTSAERRVGMIVLAMIALWLSEPLHGIHSSLVAVGGALIVTMPFVGVISFKDALKQVEWNLLLFMAATTQLGASLQSSGGSSRVDPAGMQAWHWPSFYNVVTGKTLALPNLIALQHIPLSPAGVIAKRPAPIALPNSCAA
jgi:hypothetical protein